MRILVGIILTPFAIGAVFVSAAMVVGMVKGLANSFKK